MTSAELRGLMADCLALWGIAGRVAVNGNRATIDAADGTFVLESAAPDMRPVRWLLQTPARAAADRPPRAMPSIVAALSALRNALGGDTGNTLRIGP